MTCIIKITISYEENNTSRVKLYLCMSGIRNGPAHTNLNWMLLKLFASTYHIWVRFQIIVVYDIPVDIVFMYNSLYGLIPSCILIILPGTIDTKQVKPVSKKKVSKKF